MFTNVSHITAPALQLSHWNNNKKVTLPTSVPQITLHWSKRVWGFDCVWKKKREENKEQGTSKTVPNGRYSSLSLLHIYDSSSTDTVLCTVSTWNDDQHLMHHRCLFLRLHLQHYNITLHFTHTAWMCLSSMAKDQDQ